VDDGRYTSEYPVALWACHIEVARTLRKPMNVQITTVGWTGWYPRGVARMQEHFERLSPGYRVTPWVSELPPGAPFSEGDYTGYCAKPYALWHLMNEGADIGILLDASYFPIRDITPLVDHIASVGYYMTPDGYTLGQWMSERMLEGFGLNREDTLGWPGCASGCVGIDFRRSKGRSLVNEWCAAWPLFAGFHSNEKAADQSHSYRNVGWVSDDPRVLGHRQDQSALVVIARRLGMTDYFTAPHFAAYSASHKDCIECCRATEDTVLLCEGM